MGTAFFGALKARLAQKQNAEQQNKNDDEDRRTLHEEK
jgi:hypothetical protein